MSTVTITVSTATIQNAIGRPREPGAAKIGEEPGNLGLGRQTLTIPERKARNDGPRREGHNQRVKFEHRDEQPVGQANGDRGKQRRADRERHAIIVSRETPRRTVLDSEMIAGGERSMPRAISTNV